MRKTYLLLVAAVVAVAAKPMPEEFSHQFRTGVADDPALRLTGPSAKQVAKPDDRGLRITLSSQRKDKSAIAVNPVLAMRGDCDVTLGFDLLSTEGPLSEQTGAGIVLMVKVAGSDGQAVAVSRLRRPGKDGRGAVDTFGASLVTRGKYDTKKIPALAPSGRIRLERDGGVVKVSVADGTDAEFKLIREIPVGTADLYSLSAQCRAASGGVDARFVDLTVRAESLIDETAVRHRGRYWWVLWVIGAVVLVGVTAWSLRHRARGRGSLPPSAGEVPPGAPVRKGENGQAEALREGAVSADAPQHPSAALVAPKWRRLIAVLALGTLAVGGLAWWVRAAPAVTVRGRVTVDGELLPGALVIFYPDAGRGNRSPVEPRARTDRRGAYQLQAEGVREIAPGWYRVAVVSRPAEPGENATAKSKTPVRFDRRYESPDTSGLSVFVRSDAPPGGYDLQLARRAGK
jgi:hypothetical protein